MRCLCLHGSGASSEIMQSQLGQSLPLACSEAWDGGTADLALLTQRAASLTSTLPPSYEYDFLDAPLECEAAPEIRGIYPGPYYCFFQEHSDAHMARAVEYVQEVVEEDGPYDCLIGFSQGAAVAAAYMAHASRGSSSNLEPSIKMGVFICAALINPKVATGTELTRTIGSLGWVGAQTVHVIGQKDPCHAQSTQLMKSCEKRTARVIFHNGGHDVPRDIVNSAKIAAEIERGARVAFSGI